MADRKSFWAWCLESEEPTDADRAALAAKLSARYGVEIRAKPVPSLEDAELRAPRIAVPDSVSGWCSTTVYDRARYAYGAHFTERVRAFNLDFPNPPDVVAHPRDDTEVEATLDWCDANGYVTVPYGGGSSVVWGVTPHDDLGPTVVISLDRLDQVLEVDNVSRAARIQAGVFGPHLEDQLRPSGHTLRHFPQSFRFSTLGGWIATRSGGHYATNHTHIDDFVESVRMITPAGWFQSRRLPGSGAGPSPDRMVIGSEGIYGIITEAWMRIQRRPVFRATAGHQAVELAAAELSQFGFQAIYASPFSRAQQTANIVAQAQARPAKVDTDARLADVEVGHHLSRHWRRWRRIWRLRLKLLPKHEERQFIEQKLPEGQKLVETAGPADKFLDMIRRRHKDGPILIVGHLHTYWMLSHYLRSEPLTAILRTDHFIAPASWAEFELGPEPKRART